MFAVDKDPVLTARGRVVGGTLVPGRLSIKSCLKLIDFDLTKAYFLSLSRVHNLYCPQASSIMTCLRTGGHGLMCKEI